MNRQYLIDLRNLFKQYLINKAKKRRGDANFWYAYEENDVRGNVCVALSDFYMSLANLL